MIKLLLKYKWYLALIIVLMIAEPLLNAILNFWLQSIFNSATPGADKVYVIKLLTTGFLLWMLKRIVGFAMSVLRDRYVCNAKHDVKHRMFSKLFKLNTSNLSENSSSGEYISTFTNDITLLESRFFNQIMGLMSGIFSLAILGYSFVALNWKIAVAIIGFGACTMFVPLAFSKMLNSKNLAYSEKISKFTQTLKEYFVAYPTIKNYSIEETVTDKFNDLNTDIEDTKFEADCAISLANSVGQLLAWFMQLIGVGLGIIFVIKGEIMIGTVIAAQAFANDLAMPLQSIIMNFNSIRSVKEVVNKLETLTSDYDEAVQSGDANFTPTHPALTGGNINVRFDNISLVRGDRPILDGFSFEFESTKKYLVVGLNGSGKSTVFKALKKWFSDFSGDIYVNDVNVNEISNIELSHVVSYLNENVTLFSGSIKDNISLFREYGSENFDTAITAAHVELDINREVIDEGRNISSGEQRRIEIARSLLKSAAVLIFDEVVSTLDIETAYEIEKLALGFKDKTVIFISHNFSGKLIRDYDEILVMENGKLLDHGNYYELMERCDYFKRICDIKFG